MVDFIIRLLVDFLLIIQKEPIFKMFSELHFMCPRYIIPEFYFVKCNKTFFIVDSYERYCRFFICCLSSHEFMSRGNSFKELIEECGSSTDAYIKMKLPHSSLKLLLRLSFLSSQSFGGKKLKGL